MVRKEESKTRSRTEFQPKAGIGNAAIKENMESEKHKKEIREKLISLHKAGLSLWLQKGQLHYQSASGRPAEEELLFLREHKREILKLLGGDAKDAGQSTQGENPYDEYPLTDIQAAYLLGRGKHFSYGGVSSHVYFEVLFPRLERRRAEEVWKELIDRHENLRLVITKNQKQKVQKPVGAFPLLWNENEGGDAQSDSVRALRASLENKYYDVERWPLFDIGISQAGEKSILHLSFDFLILDWTSIWILLGEFEKLYFEANAALPQIGYSFRQYCRDMTERKKSSRYLVDEEYWREELKEFTMPPLLPMAEGEVSGQFERFSAQLPVKEWKQLKDYAAEKGLTPTLAVLTAFAVSLEPWCESPDFVLNLTTMNRKGGGDETAHLIGDFSSTNLVHAVIGREQSFLENARRLQKKLVENMEHDLFSGMDVLRELRRLHAPEDYLLPIVFTSSLGSVGTDYRYMELGSYGVSQTPQVFLDCQVMEFDGRLQINMDVRKGVFPEQMTEHILCRLCELLGQLAADRDWGNIRNDNTLTEKERLEREQSNATEEPPALRTLDRMVLEQIREHPDDTAVIKGNRKTTYRTLGSRMLGIAEALKQAKVKRQERVAVMMKHSDTEVAAVLGILSIGAVYVPVDAGQPELRIRHILKKAQVRCILTDEETQIGAYEEQEVIVCDRLVGEGRLPESMSSPEESAYIIFTSGTTGEPKGVEITHRAAAGTILSVNQKLGIPEQPVVLGLSKLNFDLSVYDIFGILAKGGTIVYPEEENRVNPRHWLELMKRYEINVWNTVPALMQLLTAYRKDAGDSEPLSLKRVLLSGDWIPVTLPFEVKSAASEAVVVSLGGATEAAIWSIYHICDERDREKKSIPYGTPLANQRFYVLDKSFRDKPVWAAGELYIAGDGLARGYIGDEELTAERFVTHPGTGERLYRTGDYGRYLPGGEIEFLGRRDQQVKINGYRIELGEIEAGLLRNAAVKDACVVCDTELGEKPLLAFVCPQNKEEKEPEEGTVLADHMQQYSSSYQQKLAETKEQLEGILQIRDRLVSDSLFKALQAIGLLEGEGEDQMQVLRSSDKIAEEYRWIVTYWIRHLCRTGYLQRTDGGTFQKGDSDAGSSPYLWQTLKEEWEKHIGDAEIISYMERSNDVLLPMLAGEADPVELLYPEGSTKTVEAIYEKNLFAAYFNACIPELIGEIAKNRSGQRLRILEIGAGTGMTSKRVLERLAGQQAEYEYYFTDVARSFLAGARSKLAAYDHVHYRIYDMDRDYSEQGFVPNEFDIVLAVGVLENAKDIRKTLRNIRELLAIGGWLVFTEPISEEPWILASQMFLMQRPGDSIRELTSYIGEENWEEVLDDLCEDSGQTIILPKPTDKIAPGNMRLFAKQFHTSRSRPEERALIEDLKNYVPEYMLPRHVYVLDRLPLGANEKTDRKKLIEYGRSVRERERAGKHRRQPEEELLKPEQGSQKQENQAQGSRAQGSRERGNQEQWNQEPLNQIQTEPASNEHGQWSPAQENQRKPVQERMHENQNVDEVNAGTLQQDLCDILASVLGVSGLSPEQQLYDYGADSLLMAQAAGKVRDYMETKHLIENITFDMILRQLLNTPNVGALAKFLVPFVEEKRKHFNAQEEEGKAPEGKTPQDKAPEGKAIEENGKMAEGRTKDGHIGKLTFYGGGEGPLRVVFHAGFGTMNAMRYVIPELVAQQKGPVVGITISDSEAYCSLPDEKLVAAISEEYAGLILNGKPGRVQLIGYCLGGLIAVETVHHLIDAGVEIQDITLIDSYPAPFKVEDSLISEAVFLPNYFTSYGKVYPEITDEELMEVIGQVIKERNGDIREHQLLEFVRSSQTVRPELKNLLERLAAMTREQRFEEYAGSLEGDAGAELMLSTYRTNSASWRGAVMTPFPYVGPVRFLLAEEKQAFLFADVDQSLSFWQNVCLGEFEISKIRGNHVTCVENERNAKELVAKLGEPL